MNKDQSKPAAHPEKKNKKNLLTRKKSMDVFPDFDDELHLPVASKFR